ncbi:MAG: DUF5696 domain-containing protein [Planctomycetia bacterium]|nr:DUF5696 domain-containing protein [Planctomycetia bacterium]
MKCSLGFLLTMLAAFPLMAEDATVVFRMKDGTEISKTFPLVEKEGFALLEIAPEAVPEKTDRVEVHHPWATARAGEPGFYVFCNGLYGEFLPREKDQTYKNTQVIMPTFGVKTPRGAMAVILTGMRYESQQWVEYKEGRYRLFPVYVLDEEKPYATIGIQFHRLGENATYADMAKVYRKYQLDRGVVRPLSERMKERPELAYAAGAVEVRIRQGWKPVPSPVGEQTPENEPPMKVAVTFDRCQQIIDAFQKEGIKHAEFCLVGWNKSGHDGRFPQLFPVEPKLGGEEKLRETIRKARDLGYLIVGHTSESGAYRIAADAGRWDENYLLIRKGGVIKSLRTWGGGNVYHTCPEAVFKRFAHEDYPQLRDLGFRGLHYIDVYSTVNPRTCYSTEHPLTKEGFAEWTNRLFAYAGEALGGVGSEGGYDYCISHLDYGLYISFLDPATQKDDPTRDKRYAPSKTLPPLCDRHTPFWQIVYHGIVLYNPFTHTTNYTIKDPIYRLKLVEYGGRPMFYFYSSFLSRGSNWMGDLDLHCGTDEELAASVSKIREGYEEFEKLKFLQTAFMENHEMLEPNLFCTTYSDGTRVVCNYNDVPKTCAGQTIPAMDYVVIRRP